SATRQLAQQLGMKEGEAAADGTVIQAVAGLRSLAKKEVLEAEAREAREAAEAGVKQQAPRGQQAALEKKAQQAQKAVQISSERAQERAARQQSAPQVSRQEPEAVNQPGKDGLYRLSYKPSVLVLAGGLIVGQAVDATSEVGVLQSLLEHSQQVGVSVQSLALDTGYFQLQVLHMATQLHLDVLCPPPRSPRNAQGVPVTGKGLFAKGAFGYDAQADCYWCPAGQKLEPGQWKVEADTQLRLRHYSTGACKDCPLRAQCTASASAPRKIGRYEGEELKEVLADMRKRGNWVIARPGFRDWRATARPPRQGQARFARRLQGAPMTRRAHGGWG
ncbi:transposase, partial [Hyalangium gracile]|uniref:transposase n=1 Tax=Hyalangium gracile TaxID=394092 RepID=UPI001CCCA868